MEFPLEVNIAAIKEQEKKLGRSYSQWTKDDKITFILSDAIRRLDFSVIIEEYSQTGQWPIHSEVEEWISNLEKHQFQIAYQNNYFNDTWNIPAKEVILCQPEKGIICFTEATQEQESFLKTDKIQRKNLLFQIESNMDSLTLEQKLHAIFKEKIIFISESFDSKMIEVSDISLPEINSFLQSELEFKFVVPWSNDAFLWMILNQDELTSTQSSLKKVSQDKILKLSGEAQKILSKYL